MSVVTDVLVHVALPLEGDDYDEIIEAITEDQRMFGQTGLKQIPYIYAGGNKAFQGEIFAGAFNHLDTEEFAHWFMKLPFPEDTHAVVSLSVENEAFGILIWHHGQAEFRKMTHMPLFED